MVPSASYNAKCQLSLRGYAFPLAINVAKASHPVLRDPAPSDFCENRLMSDGMDLVELCKLVGRVLSDFAGLWRHQDIGAECARLSDGGYPVFSVVPVGAARHRQPKSLVFASQAKPDIRISDVISNDIEILENADPVLVYDRPIGSDGLRWRDLQEWWKDTRQPGSDEEAKRSLYQRLASALPGNSPPQRNLFDLYYKIHGTAVPALPALLPEVWLNWDPKTVRERGAAALLGHRMDFLPLLPNGQRVVLEVDGSHHYSSRDGTRPAPARYAAMARADRELKLSGYEVFRFGATELKDPGPARILLQAFFADLFRRFSVTP
jgi:hypothetical protein